MPFTLIDVDCSPYAIDHEYEITNENLLAEYVGELVLGHHIHILKVINSLSSTFSATPNHVIDIAIRKIRTPETDKRDGWLFQMISWLVLASRNQGENYYTQHPHFAAAQHGIDGLSILLNPDNSVKKIIITEDKCTTSPRDTIRDDVFPEFKKFESGEKDSAMIGIFGILLSNLDSGEVFQSIQNDIYNIDLRVYRIGITREHSHNSDNGRKRLLKDYEKNVLGATSDRRTGATIFIDDLRNWMNEFSSKVIIYLESKKSNV